MILGGLVDPNSLHLTPSPGNIKFLKIRKSGFEEFGKLHRIIQFRKIVLKVFKKFPVNNLCKSRFIA